MSDSLSRRALLRRASLATAALGAARLAQAPYLMAAPAPAGDRAKLRLAVIGCGGRGQEAHMRVAARENLVAIIDPDDRNIARSLKKAGEEPGVDTDKIKAFSDYRPFFDQMAREVDAVIIATPNHQHALPSMLAMQRGIAVYAEKPMAHSIHEARDMAAAAQKYKVATQMGNQGHSGEGYRRLIEYLQAGAIGNVREVYHWTNRANGERNPRPAASPVPDGLNWDNWIGPAPFRPYHKGLHPHDWHNWYDFGNGSLGNMAAHIMDGAFWALELDHPDSVEAEEITGGGGGSFPVGTRVRWDYPSRGAMPPLKVFWYDGQRADVANPGQGTGPASVDKASANMPPIMIEMEKLTGRSFDDGATFYVGDRGVMYTGTYGDGVRILPEEKHKAFAVPEKKLVRIKGTHQQNFFEAVRGGPPASAEFGYSARLTEMILLGDLAIRAGVGRKVTWDAAKMSTGQADLDAFVRPQARKGWSY